MCNDFFSQHGRSAPTSINAPQGVIATMGDNPDEIDLSCNAVTNIIEMREHSEIAAPGVWQMAKVDSRTNLPWTYRVGGGLPPPSSHTTGRAVPHPAVERRVWIHELACF